MGHRIGLGLWVALTACAPGDHEGPDPQDEALAGVDSGPTWHADIAPFLATNCGSCHTDGGIAPFPMDTYDQVVPWREAMVAAVLDGTMPPFDAAETEECTPTQPWLDDRRLHPDEIALLTAWVDDGAPEGDPATAAPVHRPELPTIENPDALVTMQQPFTLEGDDDIYMCFSIPVPHDEDVWITGVEVKPGNAAIVHHVLVWNDPENAGADRAGDDGAYRCSGLPGFFPTDMIGAWTPGNGVLRTPEGTGTLFKAGSSIVVNVHYHPTGAGTAVDETSIALEWTTEQPANHITWYLADLPLGASLQDGPNDDTGREFRIPADTKGHTETHLLDVGSLIPFPVPIYAISPHMHFLGTDMLVTLKRENQDDECLIHTPTYRFDWQMTYAYDAPVAQLPTYRPGDVLEVRCTYDNTWDNPFMGDALAAAGRDEPGTVRWGEETGDEMCMAMIGLVLPPIDLGAVLGGLF